MSPDSLALNLSFSNPRKVVARDIAAKWRAVMEKSASNSWEAYKMILLGESLEALTGQPARYEFVKWDHSGSLMGDMDMEWRLRSGAALVYRRYKCHLEDFHSVNTDADETRIEGLAPGQSLGWKDGLIRLEGLTDAERCRRLRRILPRLFEAGGAEEPAPKRYPRLEQTEFSVLLVSAGSQVLQVIAMAGKLAGLPPQQAKELVADAPVFVLEGVPRAKTEVAKNLLTGLGAAIEVW